MQRGEEQLVGQNKMDEMLSMRRCMGIKVLCHWRSSQYQPFAGSHHHRYGFCVSKESSLVVVGGDKTIYHSKKVWRRSSGMEPIGKYSKTSRSSRSVMSPATTFKNSSVSSARSIDERVNESGLLPLEAAATEKGSMNGPYCPSREIQS